MTAVAVFSLNRVNAIILRYLYLIRGSWPRLIEQAYWPTVQMIMWGFVTQFFATNSSWVAQAAGVLLAAVLLWDVLFRAQLGVSYVYMEEMYARNLGQLFASPLRPYELICALLMVSMLRTLFGVGTAALLAIPLYHYSIFSMGLPLLAFFTLLLIFGWAMGLLMCALLTRYGLGVESLVWAAVFALAPVSGIYYPIDTLPDWLQAVAFVIPSSHVFEGMRTVLVEHRFDLTAFFRSALLTLGYLALGVFVFLQAFESARERGSLLHSNE